MDGACNSKGQETSSPPLSHDDFMKVVDSKLASIIREDPVLRDLPRPVTCEEVEAQIAVEHGQAITVFLRKMDGEVLPIVLKHSATVSDLKQAIQRHVSLKLAREGGSQHVSWRHVWSSYHLFFQGHKLNCDSKHVFEYGIINKDEVTFIPRLKSKLN